MLLLILMISGCGSQPTSKIVVGMDESPLGYHNEQGELVGFDVDLAKETAKRMGVAVEFKIIDWDNKEEELNSGNIDLIWNGMDITPERREVMLFSKPYMDNRQVIVVLKGNPEDITHEDDLAGKIVGVKAGTTSAIYLSKTENLKNSIKELKTYADNESTFIALENKEIDAIVCDEIIGRYEMVKNRNHFEIVDVTVGPVAEYGIGFRKGDTELRDRVQKAFQEIVKDGTAKKIFEKWFQADLIKLR